MKDETEPTPAPVEPVAATPKKNHYWMTSAPANWSFPEDYKNQWSRTTSGPHDRTPAYQFTCYHQFCPNVAERDGAQCEAHIAIRAIPAWMSTLIQWLGTRRSLEPW